MLIAVVLLLQGCSIFSSEKPVKKTMPTTVTKTGNYVTNGHYSKRDDYLYYYIAHSFNHADLQAEQAGDTEPQMSDAQTESDQEQGMASAQTELNINQEASKIPMGAQGYGRMYSFNGEKSLMLSEVVSKMADQLLNNFPEQYHNESIALTSIVDLRDHKVTNWIGQTISEQFIHELHIRNLRVVDFKLTGNIQLTPQGEFALTRDWKKLNKNVGVRRILTGTMSRNEEGVILNVRIVNVDSNIVESTSSAFIPHGMFVGGEYEYRSKRYYSRNSAAAKSGKAQVRLVN